MSSRYFLLSLPSVLGLGGEPSESLYSKLGKGEKKRKNEKEKVRLSQREGEAFIFIEDILLHGTTHFNY